MAPHARMRRGAAGREDAGDGWVRDGHPDPATGQVTPHPDHLPHGGGQEPDAGRPRILGWRRGLPGQADRAGVRPVQGGRVRRARQEERAAASADPAAAGERAGSARAGGHASRAGERPGTQESGARELQLRRLTRPAGAASPDRELQPGRAGGTRATVGRDRPALPGPGSRGEPADVATHRRRAVPGPRHPGGDAGAGSGLERPHGPPRRADARGRARPVGGGQDPPRRRGQADGQLLRIALENLLENAWKFTARTDGRASNSGSTHVAGEPTYFVRDNGAGFDMAYADRLFGPFQRLHLAERVPGTGIGLATVQRIVHRHGGRVWAEGMLGQGATFHFTLGRVRA